MLHAAKFRLYPTKEQEKFLWGQWGAVRFVWNKALALKQRFYKRDGTNLSVIHDLKPLLAVAKKSRKYSWLKLYDSIALQEAVRHLDGAFNRFFKQEAGFPRWKSRRGEQSSYHCTCVSAGDGWIRVPKIGRIKAVTHRPVEGKVKSITIDGQREITLEVGQTATLTASVKPADAPIKTCSWDSSNTSVATIDSSTGVVTAVGAGTTQITASADDGGFVDNITVTVKGNGLELKGISLSSTALNLKPQQAATLNAVLDPEGAQASLSWKSSDESIVRVSGNGASAQLTAVNAGSAQVTVSSSDGKFTAACQITVSTSSQEAPGIVFAQTNMSLTVGQPQNISLTITPSGADVGKISWNASSDAISVQEGYNGTDVLVTGVKAGTAVLTASTESGLQASCTITVKEEGSTDTTGQVKLSVSPLVLNAGEEGQLQYAVDPSGTQLTFTSSDPRIADVNDKGYVTTIIHLDQTTDVTITVKTADGSVSAQTTVTVMAAGGSSQGSQQGGQTQGQNQNQGSSQEQGTQADLGLYSESSWESVEVGYTKLLPLHVGLAEGDVTIKCSSSDRSIAQVDNEGMVTGVGPGSATITITATDNNTGDYQTITVEVEVEGSGFGYGTSDPQPDEEENSRGSGERG